MIDDALWLLFEKPLISLLSSTITFIPIYIAYVLFLHPLSHIPGPLIRRLTSLPLLYSSWVGREASTIVKLHAKYGPIVLLSPNDVDIDDGAAISPIYVEQGGFKKPHFYRNFDFEEHQTIFSTSDPARRATRAKSVTPLFATGRIREAAEGGRVIDECVNDFIAALEQAKATRAEAIDLLDLSRRLAIEVVTGYLFGQLWGSFAEGSKADINGKLSVSPFVDSLVGIGKVFRLSNKIFAFLCSVWPTLQLSKEALTSSDMVEGFTQEAVDAAGDSEEDTYQKRLLSAGISKGETQAQMKDVMFAGTDSTGTTMSKMLWNITKYPELQEALHKEIMTSSDGRSPLLHATVREALRTAMPNPTPLVRVVPEQGWTYTAPLLIDESPEERTGKSFQLPAGTQVGVQLFSLHFNAEKFPDPVKFNPYRWLSTNEMDKALNISNNNPELMTRMHRDWLPFGAGPRQCIARNLATEELTIALKRVIQSRVLERARVVSSHLPMREWFNSQLTRRDGILISFAEA